MEKTITGRTTSQVIKQDLLFLPLCKKERYVQTESQIIKP